LTTFGRKRRLSLPGCVRQLRQDSPARERSHDD